MNDGIKDFENSLTVAPLLGFPGLRLNNSTVAQNLFDASKQSDTLIHIYNAFHPDILFTLMDLSAEAHALGLPVRYAEMESPSVKEHPIKDSSALKCIDLGKACNHPRLKVFADTIKKTKQVLPDVPLSAYITGPFTLAGLMMGANDIAMNTILKKDFVKQTLELSFAIARHYSHMLFDSGADMVTILEPTAVMLSPEMFWEFSGAYIKNIVHHIDNDFILHICGNSEHLIGEMLKTGCFGLSLDADVDFTTIAPRIPEHVKLIGNINPVSVMVDMPPEKIRIATQDLIRSMEPYSNFILSTGCDLPPETPHANITAFIMAGKNLQWL